jgi:hypothetical protein
MENNFNCSEADYNDYKEYMADIIEADKKMTDYSGQIGEAMETSIKNYDKIAAKHLEKNKKPCDCKDRWDIEHPPPLDPVAVPFGRNFGRNAGGSKRRKSKRRKSKRKNSKRRKSKRRKSKRRK